MKLNPKLALVALAAFAAAFVQAQKLDEGTQVKLAFDQSVSSKTAKAGDRIKLHVAEDVKVDGKVVIPAGTRASAVVSSVKKRGRYGKNAQLQLTLNPIHVRHTNISLEPRQKGKQFKGSRTDKAAIATGAGAVILGPVGLVGGLFVPGKEVKIKKGDPLITEVSRSVDVH